MRASAREEIPYSSICHGLSERDTSNTRRRRLRSSPATTTISRPQWSCIRLLLALSTCIYLTMVPTSAFCVGLIPVHVLSTLSKHTSCFRKRMRNDWSAATNDYFDEIQRQQDHQRPIPPMPSLLFRELAQSQLELLATSLVGPGMGHRTKVRSMALYLPQENQETGQLQFIPAVLYPHPDSDRVFIAPESDSRGLTLPNMLSKLPGFAHASMLIPNYPMVSGSTEAGIGAVEEVLCDIYSKSGAAALSVPLFAGSQTVGVLLVSPDDRFVHNSQSFNFWTDMDRQKVANAAQSLSLALTMDSERTQLAQKNRQIQEALSDSLHQLKNPVQALRTYGKLLQQRIAESEESGNGEVSIQLLELVNHLMVQSDRVVDRLGPVDSIVDALGADSRPRYALGPARLNQRRSVSIVPWSPTVATLAQSRSEGNVKQPGINGHYMSLLENVELEMGFLEDVLSETLSAFKAMALERGIDFVVDLPEELPGVMMNPEALQEVVSNLLDNAFKYVLLPKTGSLAKENPQPRVRIRFSANAPPLPAGATILVEDNGPGISENEYDVVFSRGYRGPATKHEVSGSGIGLNIVRALVQKMNGTVRVIPPGHHSNSLFDGTTMELLLRRGMNGGDDN